MNIKGNSVILREMEAKDQVMLESLIHDPEIVKITGGYLRPAFCRMQVSGCCRPSYPTGGLRRVIADQEHPETGLGIIMLSHMDPEKKTAEIYIKLAGSARGRGYGRDAVDTLVSYAFRELGLHEICSSILEHNTASRRLFEACGFQLKSMHGSRADREGHCRNVYLYCIKNHSTDDI